LQWLHNGTPPDLHLALARDVAEQWTNAAAVVLLGELRRRAPDAIDWDAMADVVPVVDAFEAHMASKSASRH
jgi:hypothetical protein